MRNYTAEAAALPIHTFDTLMHYYMMRTFRQWFIGVSALELGCFRGEMTARIFKEYPELTVVDASEDCILEAMQNLRLVEFIHSTFEMVDLGERKFDAVFLIHSLEHVDDPVAVLKRCKGWLAKDGKLFVAVPNGFAASRQIACKMGLVERPTAVTPAEREHGHRRTYNQYSFEADLLRSGLHPVEQGGIMFKALANAQMDAALKHGVITTDYLEGCYKLGAEHPDMCASLYAVCEAA